MIFYDPVFLILGYGNVIWAENKICISMHFDQRIAVSQLFQSPRQLQREKAARLKSLQEPVNFTLTSQLSTCTMQLACLERCSDQWSPIRAMPMIPMRTANHATSLKWTEVPMQLSHLHGIICQHTPQLLNEKGSYTWLTPHDSRWSHQPRHTYPFIHLPSTYWAT